MEQKTLEQLTEILHHFLPTSNPQSIRAFGDGHINDTFAVETPEEGESNYVLQRINTNVFLNADALMENISNVTEYLKEQLDVEPNTRWRTLVYLPCVDGKPYYRAEDGSCWRVYQFVANTKSIGPEATPTHFYESALAFGKFVKLLDRYPAETLHETIASFHDTESRYRALCLAAEQDVCCRKAEVLDDLSFVEERREEIPLLNRMRDRGELPVRVTHNDTKLNNVLFDADTERSVCVIDLDTVMPGLLAYDYGDAIRFGANKAEEDATDLDSVGIDLDKFATFTDGFLHYGQGTITRKEIETLPLAARTLTLECGMRFLTDYLNGDVYFKTSHPKHNLERARNQFRLVADMEAHTDEMQRLVFELAKKNHIL